MGAREFFSTFYDPLSMGYGDLMFGVKNNDNGDGNMANISTLDVRNPDLKRVQGSLADWIQKFLPEYTPGQSYAGKLSAPASSYEMTGLNFLNKFLQNPDYTNLLSDAGNEVSKTLNNDYDPYTSKFYQAARDAAKIEQKDALDTQNAQLGSRGKYFSSEALRENRELNTRTTNFLQNILGQLSENERDRRLQVLPQAQSINEAMTKAPLQKAVAGTTVGSLPRELEQADYERQYQDYLRTRQESAQPVNAAMGFGGGNLQTVATNPAQSFSAGNFIADMLPYILMMLK